MTTKPYAVVEVDDAGQKPCTCDGCGWVGTAEHVADIETTALTPGHPSPVGRCPECNELAYVESELEAAFCRTDWDLFKRQKAALIEASADSEALAGLLIWIDTIQDAIVEQGLLPAKQVFAEKDVFGVVLTLENGTKFDWTGEADDRNHAEGQAIAAIAEAVAKTGEQVLELVSVYKC